MPIVEGIVCLSPGGAASNDSVWNLVLHLAPWSGPEGHIDEEPLRVEQIVGSEAQLKKWMQRLSKGDAIEVTTPRIEANGHGRSTVHATRIAKIAKSPRLKAAEKQHARPVVVRDAVLGRLALDRQLDTFVGRRKLAGRRYSLWVFREPRTEPAAQVLAMRPRVLAFERAYPRILAATVQWAAPLYNDNWRDSRRQLTVDQIERRLRFSLLQVGTTDRTTASFDAGTLFFDHGVEVRMGPSAGIREILLA